MMTLATPDTPVKDRDLLEAISLRFCRHFPALNMANALGGMSTIPWKVVREFKPDELLVEAKERDLDLSSVETAMATCECCPRLVIESALYIKVSTGIESYPGDSSIKRKGD